MSVEVANVDIELTLEDYFFLNELARKEEMILDDFIAKILKEKIEEMKSSKSQKSET